MKGQNRSLARPFPTWPKERPLFFQNPLLPEVPPGPCRLEWKGRIYGARIHHAEVAHRGRPFGRRPPNHAHAVYHLVLVTSGKGHFRLGDRLVPVSRGVLVTTGPGDPHCFERTPSESTGYAEATFDFRTKGGRCLELPFSGMLASWLGRPSPCRPVQMISEPATQALERTLQNVVRSGFSSEQVPLRSSCALMRVLEECHWATCRPPAPAMPWEKARLFLLEHYASDVSIASLAGRLGVHPDYLTRSFRRAYGMAPLAFQNSLRLEAAKSWLLSTDYPLKEIADRAGFQDAGYFGRLFRKRAGMTPGRFRKAKRAGR